MASRRDNVSTTAPSRSRLSTDTEPRASASGFAHTKPDAGEEHLRRVRRICAALPETTEKLSHGEPTFFVRKKVFAMFSNNHHHDGHIAVMIPAPPGHQAVLIHSSPEVFYNPPYVGVRGWVGIELDRIGDEDLAAHIHEAWQLITSKRPKTARKRSE